MIAASREVLDHHASLHLPCGKDVPAAVHTCPCGRSVIIGCGECGQQLYFASKFDRLCEHAADVL